MIKAYINYPNPHVAIHCDLGDPMIDAHRGAGIRRETNINLHNLSEKLNEFVQGKVKFAAEAGLNGMWLNIDLGDREFEISVVNFVTRQLGHSYIPFSRVTPEIHCK